MPGLVVEVVLRLVSEVQTSEFAGVVPVMGVDCILSLVELLLHLVLLDGQVVVLVFQGHRLGLHLVGTASIGLFQPRLVHYVALVILLGLTQKLASIEAASVAHGALLGEPLGDLVSLFGLLASVSEREAQLVTRVSRGVERALNDRANLA